MNGVTTEIHVSDAAVYCNRVNDLAERQQLNATDHIEQWSNYTSELWPLRTLHEKYLLLWEMRILWS